MPTSENYDNGYVEKLERDNALTDLGAIKQYAPCVLTDEAKFMAKESTQTTQYNGYDTTQSLTCLNGYLIGPIDQSCKDDQNWKLILDTIIASHHDGPKFFRQNFQITLYDPAKSWLLNNNFSHHKARRRFIEDVNISTMRASDFAIANLPKSVFSFGSVYEIDWYYQSNKPVIIATDIPYGANVYLSNRVNPAYYVEYSNRSIKDIMQEVFDKIVILNGMCV
jgi:nucleoside 2-deoxyribosyltransferase